MNRINITVTDESGQSRVIGWFDQDKATTVDEGKFWDGSNNISHATGSQWDHEEMIRTAQGRWVKCAWSDRQGVQGVYSYVTEETVREWLLRNYRDGEAEKFFGEIEEERGPGRPAIGEPVNVRLGDDLLAQVDTYASDNGYSRAEAVRVLLGEALTATQPYTVTFRDISTGQREIRSRHATLGAAVEELRKCQAGDYESQQYQGLPSWQHRVEHDGRPVDVEAVRD